MIQFLRKKMYTFFVILISIVIIFSCAYFHSLKVKEGLTNNNKVILMGDSVLNNSNYAIRLL